MVTCGRKQTPLGVGDRSRERLGPDCLRNGAKLVERSLRLIDPAFRDVGTRQYVQP
jgi:hypothetical protein